MVMIMVRLLGHNRAQLDRPDYGFYFCNDYQLRFRHTSKGLSKFQVYKIANKNKFTIIILSLSTPTMPRGVRQPARAKRLSALCKCQKGRGEALATSKGNSPPDFSACKPSHRSSPLSWFSHFPI